MWTLEWVPRVSALEGFQCTPLFSSSFRMSFNLGLRIPTLFIVNRGFQGSRLEHSMASGRQIRKEMEQNNPFCCVVGFKNRHVVVGFKNLHVVGLKTTMLWLVDGSVLYKQTCTVWVNTISCNQLGRF